MPTNPKSIKCVGTNYAMGLPRYHCHWDFMPSWILRHVDDMYVFVYYLFCILLYYCFSTPLFLCRRSRRRRLCFGCTHTHTHTLTHGSLFCRRIPFHSLHLSLAPQPIHFSCVSVFHCYKCITSVGQGFQAR